MKNISHWHNAQVVTEIPLLKGSTVVVLFLAIPVLRFSVTCIFQRLFGISIGLRPSAASFIIIGFYTINRRHHHGISGSRRPAVMSAYSVHPIESLPYSVLAGLRFPLQYTKLRTASLHSVVALLLPHQA